MVKITFFENSNDVVFGFDVFGHAGSGAFGEDIVCAAISSAVYMVLNTITDVKRIVPILIKLSDGNVSLRLSFVDAESCSDILSGFGLHTSEISRQYPKKVCVIHKKI